LADEGVGYRVDFDFGGVRHLLDTDDDFHLVNLLYRWWVIGA
jgi:hypothetical protein